MFNYLLKTFVCVADCGSFNRAAERLYHSPPAVMKQINTLEDHLKLTLFERSNSGVTLTAQGQVIYNYALKMFELSAQAMSEARQAGNGGHKVFNIGSSILNPCQPFMDLWFKVQDQFAGYTLNIVPFEDNNQDILQVIASLGSRFDFLVGVCDSRLWLDRCNFCQLGTFNHCCAVARSHPLAQKSRLKISDLFGQTVMMVEPGDSRVVDQIRSDLSSYPEIKIADTSWFYDMSVFNLCAQGNLVLISLECWHNVHPGLVSIPVDWDYPIPFGLLYPKAPNADIMRLISLIAPQSH